MFPAALMKANAPGRREWIALLYNIDDVLAFNLLQLKLSNNNNNSHEIKEL